MIRNVGSVHLVERGEGGKAEGGGGGVGRKGKDGRLCGGEGCGTLRQWQMVEMMLGILARSLFN